jgi:hypothetical protein
MPRKPHVERDYFIQRAQDHAQLAESASDEAHKALHLQFSALYRDRAKAISIVEED